MDDTAELTNPGPLTQILAAGGNTDPSPSFASASENAPPVAAPDVSGNPTADMPATSSLGGQLPPPREPGTSELGKQPYHKAEFFRSMLGDFLYSVGKGLSARGSGPEADSRGAGAAMSALPERNIMQQQIAIQRQQAQSEADLRAAQANKAQQEAQSVPVTLGNGQQVYLPASIAKQILAAQQTGKSRENVAQTNATSRENVADTGANSRENVANIGAESRQNVAATNAANKPDNEISLIKKANAGDKVAKAALDTLMANRKEVAAMRTSNIAKEVVAYDEDGTPYTKYVTAADAIKQGLSSAPQGAKNLSKVKQIEDIEFSSQKLRAAVNGLDRPFNPEQIAKLQVALQSDDEGAVHTQISALANDALTSKQQDFVLWVKHINERALSLRNIAGQGQGAQDTRNAIRALLPGAATGNVPMMNKMLDAFDNQVSILKSGIPRAGGAKKTALTADEARGYLQKAGGDANKARALARKDGRSF